MGDEGRIRPMEPIEDNISSARRPVPGTVSRTNLNNGSVYFTGTDESGTFAQKFPLAVDSSLIKLGNKEYHIFCVVCHGQNGEGNGQVVRHGFTNPGPYPAQMAPGFFFYTMTNGAGDMDKYRDVLNEKERWAVAAYIKNGLLSKKELTQ